MTGLIVYWPAGYFSHTPSTMQTIILGSLDYQLDYLQGQVGDLESAEWVQQPQGHPNHALWQVGHLAVSFQSVLRMIGRPGWLEDSWKDQFGYQSTPSADLATYPPSQEMLHTLHVGYERLKESVAQLPESAWQQDLPPEPYGKSLGTLGTAINQMLVGHTAYHLAQLTAWRRALSKPRLAESFL